MANTMNLFNAMRCVINGREAYWSWRKRRFVWQSSWHQLWLWGYINNDPIIVPVCLKNGSTHLVPLERLGSFIRRHKDEIAYQKSTFPESGEEFQWVE